MRMRHGDGWLGPMDGCEIRIALSEAAFRFSPWCHRSPRRAGSSHIQVFRWGVPAGSSSASYMGASPIPAEKPLVCFMEKIYPICKWMTGWWFGCHQIWHIFPEILRISSSQLTNSYFSEGWPKTTNQMMIWGPGKKTTRGLHVIRP